MIVRDEKGRFIKGHTGYKPWLGKHLPAETREKLSQAHLGRRRGPHSESHRKRISQAHLAKGLSYFINCESCKVSVRVPKSRPNARFCSVKCRAKVVMPPAPSRLGTTPWNKGKTRLNDQRLNKIAVNRTGEKNWMYEHGNSKAHRSSWGTAIHKAWRKAVFDRDDYTCQLCFTKGGTLQADHIKCFAHHEDVRYDVGNGRTLCFDCHRSTKNYGTHKRENCRG